MTRKSRSARAGVLVCFILGGATSAFSQTAPTPNSQTQPAASMLLQQPRRSGPLTRPRSPRPPVTISLNGGVQTTSRGFGSTSTIRRFEEDGTLTSSYSGDRPVVYDLAINAGIWRGLSAGVGATQASKPLGGEITAEVPHPFFFDQARTVSGTMPGVTRKEVAVHVNAGWTVPVSRSTHFMVFAGPSYFRMSQGLVVDVDVTEAYPFDTATFGTAKTTDATQSRWGFHAGVDLTRRLSRYFGVGVIARYSRALFTFPIVDTQQVDIEAGGLQLGAGARLQF